MHQMFKYANIQLENVCVCIDLMSLSPKCRLYWSSVSVLFTTVSTAPRMEPGIKNLSAEVFFPSAYISKVTCSDQFLNSTSIASI